jgi:alpha-galactosidase
MSVEYASRIINALATGKPFVFNGNVHNRGGALISNLPGDACVEVPCVVDRQGIQPVSVGELPPQCAALIRPNISVQDLAVRGILEGDRTRIRQAVMMDPNTASQISLSTMDKMLDAMFEAHASRLPDGM